MTIRNFPYRRDIRPASVESLGEHTDREFEKIETALAAFELRIAGLEASSPMPTPAPIFSVQPSISPSSGTAGETFTASDGTASDTTSYARRWLLDDVEIGTSATITPESAGSLVLEVTATGAGGSTVATSDAATVEAALATALETLATTLSTSANSDCYDFTQATNTGTWTATGLAGKHNLTQATVSNQPAIDGTLGAVMDGSRFISAPFAPATYTVVLALRKDIADLDGIILFDGGSNVALRYVDGGGATIGAASVDGASTPNRNTLHDALDDGAEHVVMITGLSTAAWVALGMGHTTSAGLIGSIRRAAVICESDFVDIAAVRTQAIAAMGEA